MWPETKIKIMFCSVLFWSKPSRPVFRLMPTLVADLEGLGIRLYTMVDLMKNVKEIKLSMAKHDKSEQTVNMHARIKKILSEGVQL